MKRFLRIVGFLMMFGGLVLESVAMGLHSDFLMVVGWACVPVGYIVFSKF